MRLAAREREKRVLGNANAEISVREGREREVGLRFRSPPESI